MATRVKMRHSITGIERSGWFGFSWTSLFFSGVPAMMRGDVLIGLAVTAVALYLSGGTECANEILFTQDLLEFGNPDGGQKIAFEVFEPAETPDVEFQTNCFVNILGVTVNFLWALVYNKIHMQSLLAKGYVFDDVPELVMKAKRTL